MGREVEIVDDISQINEKYQHGEWIVATGPHLKDLEESGQFEVVFKKLEAVRHKGKPVSGALFHKFKENR